MPAKQKNDDSRSCLHRLMCANRNEEPEDYESEIEWAIGPSTPSSLQETEKKQNTRFLALARACLGFVLSARARARVCVKPRPGRAQRARRASNTALF